MKPGRQPLEAHAIQKRMDATSPANDVDQSIEDPDSNPRWNFRIEEESSVKSAARVFKVFQVFAHLRTPLKHADVARHMGIPPSSTSMLLWSMVRLGYLSFDPGTKMFFPTQRVTAMGDWIRDAPTESRLTAATQRLARQTGEMVITGTQCGNYIRYLDVVQPVTPIGIRLEPGVTRPLPAVNLGIALLSTKTDRQIEFTIRALNANPPAGWSAFDLRETMKAVESIRTRGYIHLPSLVLPGGSVIGAVLDTDPVMVIGVGFNANSASTPEEVIRAVRTIADEAAAENRRAKEAARSRRR